MARRTALAVILKILAGLLVLLGLAALAIFIRLSSGPIEVAMFRDDVARNVSNARGGRGVEVGEVTLEWLRSERRVVFVASDLILLDDAGVPAAKAGRAELLVNTAGILSGELQPIGLALSDGRVEIRRTDTGWVVAGDPVGTINTLRDEASVEPPPTMRALVDRANDALVDIFAILRDNAAAASLETIRFEDVEIEISDEVRGTTALLSGAVGELVRSNDGLSAIVSGESDFGEDGPGQFTASASLPSDYSSLSASFALDDWSVASVADWIPGPPVEAEDIPANLALDFVLTEEAGLTGITTEIEIGSGTITLADRSIPITGLTINGQYDLAPDRLVLDVPQLEFGPISTSARLEMETLLRSDGPRAFTFEAPEMVLDLQPVFSAPWPARRFRVAGTFWPRDLRLAVERLSLSTGEANLIANGDLTFLRDLEPGDMPVQLKAAAEMSGALSHTEFLKFWPVRQAAGARNYVSNNVLAGMVTDAAFVFDFKRRSRAKGYFEEDAIDGTFSVTGVDVRPLSDVPPIVKADMTGRITGNSTRLDFRGGRLGLWQLDSGYVHYPQLSPPGADMMVGLSGRGPARNIVQIISDSRLQLQERTGFDPATVTGEATLDFELTRPALPDVPASEYRYNGKGQVSDAGIAGIAAGYDLVDSDARVELDQNGIRIFGFGNISGVPLQYDWRNGFTSEAGPGRLQASGLLTPSGLNELGVPARAYFSGEAPIELQAELDGSTLQDVNATIDFTDARLDVSEVGWIKTPGNAANLSLEFSQGDNDTTDFLADFQAENAKLTADIAIERSGRLVSLDVDRAFLDGSADLAGTARRDEDGGLVFRLQGAFLDLSEVVTSMPQVGGGGSSMAASFGNIDLAAEIDQLRLRDGFDMLGAKMSLTSTAEGLRTAEAVGVTQTGAPLSAAFDASGLGDPAFRVTSGDASFLASVFFGFDSLEDGDLEIAGTFARGDLPTQIRIGITDGRLKDAPLLTQILSLASIRGMSDTLSGDGVLFTDIDIPLAIAGGRYNIVGAKASGPALGFTANGWVNTDTGGIDIDGVLVPSFGINSALGGIPLIGDLFVSRDGEGVISLRYGVKGTLERAQISVNPLSAVTPGVLRRIFEDPENEDFLEDIEDETANANE
ncbi:MAG: AsmA-like C-terminal region-containing protein [Pseudomonadota bacterium]